MLAVAILAAGKGTRMMSSLPKVLHKLAGKTLIERILNSCFNLEPDKIFIIVGHKANEIKASLKNHKYRDKIIFVSQNPQKGTGHAIQVLSKKLTNYKGKLLVLNGDVPLIETNSLKELIKNHNKYNADASIITTNLDNPFGYGRVFVKDNLIQKIVEEKDCNPTESLNKTINAGIYCFKWSCLSKIIKKLNSDNAQDELYLTDTISMVNKAIAYELINKDEVQGINNRIQLSECEKIIQRNLKKRHMLNGVTFVNAESSTVSEECEIGIDVIIEANTHIRGNSIIGSDCIIGPNTFIKDTTLNKGCEVINSTIFNSEIMENVRIGPYSHIRPNCKLSSKSKIGNFVEIKNSSISEAVKVNHLSYIGDCNIGKSTNIGAGTITANFDGIKKHKTSIGENCRVGSNSVLIAPLNVDNSVTIGAGSVINKDVDDNSLAISRAKQINIKNWKKNSID